MSLKRMFSAALPVAGSGIRRTAFRVRGCHARAMHRPRLLAGGQCFWRSFSSDENSQQLGALLGSMTPEDQERLRSMLTTDESGETRLPGAMHGGPKMAVLFTCTVCNTRSARQFSKQSYEEGVVLIRCPGCDNLHLFADRLGWFDDDSVDIETIMREKGEEVGWVTSAEGIEFANPNVVDGEQPPSPEP